MNILITGFEPFGARKANNSWEVVKAFKNRKDIKVLYLPVSFSRAHKVVIELIKKQPFNLIIMLGETSATNDYIRLERVAINFKDSINTDNDNIIANEEILVEEAPKAYFTKIPVKKIMGQLKESGYPVRITNSAGTFVCNSLYYHILHYIETNKLTTKTLFIHVPDSTQKISLEEMQNTLDEIIKISLSYTDE